MRQQPGVACTLMGARDVGQLHRNLKSLDLELSPETLASLNAAGDEVKTLLGENLDVYESRETSRVQ